MKVLSIGNINVDITLVVNKIPGPDEAVEAREVEEGFGGSAANFAVAFSRLGGSVSIYGFVGRDEEGVRALDNLRKEGLDTSRVVAVDKPTGRVYVIVGGRGERAMVAFRGANLMLRRKEAADLSIGEYRLVHMAGVVPDVALRIAEKVAEKGVLVSLDPGFSIISEHAPALKQVFARANYVFLNTREYRLVRAMGLETSGVMVVKKGEKGAEVVGKGGQPAFRTRAVDTTGAGDVFDAAFLRTVLCGGSLEDALIFANAAAAIKVSRKGAMSSPTLREVLSFLEERGLSGFSARMHDILKYCHMRRGV